MIHGRPAGKRLGQHFLADRHAARRIVDALELRDNEPVLEIGPGNGALTSLLVEAAGRILAIELDRVLAAGLRKRFDPSRLVLVERDIRSVPLLAALELLGRNPSERLVVVGNLPYNISKPLTQKLILEREQVGRAVLMFQREVADRLTADEGRSEYGPLGILARQSFEIESLFHLPPRAFRPPPRVHSTVTRWIPRADPLTREAEGRLRACLAVVFARRRRTLRNNLRQALIDGTLVDDLLRTADLDGSLRAEQLSPADLLRLAAHWKEPWRGGE